MQELGRGFYYNDLEVGQKFKTIGRTIFEGDIINFVGVTGMQELLFTNLEYIRDESPTGKRIAPAVLVLAIAEGLVMAVTLQRTGMAFLGMDLDMKGPVVAGDPIHVELEVTEVRPASRGNRGLVRTRNSVANQRGETVMVYSPLRMMKGRE